MMRKFILTVVLASFAIVSQAQALRGTTGLLHAPSAEFEKDGTFKMGANYLAAEPLHYYYKRRDTGNYYFNITFFHFLEVGYTCTLNYAPEGSTYYPPYVWGKYCNQDRSFYGRLLLWKEGLFYDWTPQIVGGLDDPMTHTGFGGGEIVGGGSSDGGMNAYFTRYYLAATKHFNIKDKIEIGAHMAYVIDRASVFMPKNGVTAGVNLRPTLSPDNFWRKAVNGFNMMIEYDLWTVNCGFEYSFLGDRFRAVFELNDWKNLSGGIQYRKNLLKWR